MKSWESSFGDGIYGDAATRVSTVGIDERRIREYVQWQENKEQEIEKLQGNLFGEEEGKPVTAHLLGQIK